MRQRKANGGFFGIATIAAMFVGLSGAQAQVSMQAQETPDKSETVLQVGTYDAQKVFKQHPAQAELAKALSTAQEQFQTAQQEGDQQKMQQIQQEYQKTQGQVTEKFQQDVAGAMPVVARAVDVDVVALEVIYKTEEVRARDITSELGKAFGKTSEEAPGDAPDKSEAALQVGTYDVEKVLQSHPAQTELAKAYSAVQEQYQAAQQAGDQQKMQQIQQQYEATRGQVIEQFQQDVNKAMPTVAKDVGTKLVALEVVYQAKEVKTKDITSQLIEALKL